jgi:hypothetical protein
MLLETFQELQRKFLRFKKKKLQVDTTNNSTRSIKLLFIKTIFRLSKQNINIIC